VGKSIGYEYMNKGTTLEDTIARHLFNNGFIVFIRRNHCDIIAWRGGLAYVVECKSYDLSKKQQTKAVKQLNNNRKRAIKILDNMRLSSDIILKVLIANSFHHRSHGIYQYTPEEFIDHLR